MSQMIFYNNPYSRGRIAQWMLDECHAEYELRLTEFDEIKEAHYLSINPMGKLPALVIIPENKEADNIVITEVSAICTYLADRYPEANLAPSTDDPERGNYYRWLFWACNVLEPAMMVKDQLLTREQSERADSCLGFGSFDEAIEILDNALADRDYLCADQFTTADLYIAAMLHWALFHGTVRRLPDRVDEYVDRMMQREAFIDEVV